MAGPDNNGLREALIDTLNKILSPVSEVRKSAEEQIKILEVTEEFGVHLVELTLDQSSSLPIRQLSSVLLKQYVEAHWSSESTKFRLPECSEMAKAKIRELLPHGLHEPISKVRSSIAYAISAIADWDWPEQWAGLFDILMAAIKSGDEAPVHGAMRVLTEFSRDLSDQHLPTVAPVILPEMYRIFCEEEKFSIRTRGRAVEIFTTFVNLICMIAEVNKPLAKTLLYPSLPPFIQSLVNGLQTPDGFTSDSGLKKEILHAFNILIKRVPKNTNQYLQQILGPIWQTLTSSADTYMNTIVNASEDADDPTDSDGDVIGFESLVFALFEFVNTLIDSPQRREMIKSSIPDLIYYIILYMQITEEQIQIWSNNPDDFVRDEDENSLAFSIRISAQDLLLSLCHEMYDESSAGLVIALNRHLERATALKNSGDPTWWKAHEALLLSFGSIRDLFFDQIAKGSLNFDLNNFITNVVMADLDPNLPPFLAGRALWCGSRYAQALTPDIMTTFLQATVSGLNESPNPIIKISAVRAAWGFCDYLKGIGSQDTLQPYLPTFLNGLVNMATHASSEVLSLILETITIVVSIDQGFTTANISQVSTLCLAVFIKANNDPVLVQLVQDVVRELCGNPGCTQTLQTKFVPTLTSILNAASDKISPSMQAVALDMLEVMVRSSTLPLTDSLMGVVFPTVVQRTLHSDDLSTQQNGGECLRAFVSKAPEQVINYRDGQGQTGLQYIVQVATHLLSPSTVEQTAAFVGRLITVLIKNTVDHLGEGLDQLLRAVLSKLQGAETVLVIENLVLVYAHLVHIQLEGVLTFLSGVPGPTGQSALAFVLAQWCSKQPVFYGAYERKVLSVALAKLLEHGVTTQDVRFQDIIVPGDQIFSPDERIRTRSQKTKVEQWTEVPILVKLFKLIIYELSNAIDSCVGKDDEDLEEDEGWEDEENGDTSGDNSVLFPTPADLLFENDTVEEDEDADALADPLYELDLKKYLTNYISTFAQHPAYEAFVPHLNPHEREVLQGLGIQC